MSWRVAVLVAVSVLVAIGGVASYFWIRQRAEQREIEKARLRVQTEVDNPLPESTGEDPKQREEIIRRLQELEDARAQSRGDAGRGCHFLDGTPVASCAAGDSLCSCD